MQKISYCKDFMLLEMAKINLAAHKLRAFLAILGILIGSAAVVALLYSSQLATKAVITQLSRLGTNLISAYGGEGHFSTFFSDSTGIVVSFSFTVYVSPRRPASTSFASVAM